jgi:hypothetical protein
MTEDMFHLYITYLNHIIYCDFTRFWFLGSTTGATSGAGIANPSGSYGFCLLFLFL